MWNEANQMLSVSHPFSLPNRKADRVDNPPNTSISTEQRVHALEAEITALQKLVCDLLEKNERLRMQLKRCE